MILKKVGLEDVDWTHLTEDKGHVAVSSEHGKEQSSSINCWQLLEWLTTDKQSAVLV
jgi:hypothetical protein